MQVPDREHVVSSMVLTAPPDDPPDALLRREGIEPRHIYWIDGSKIGYVGHDGRAHTAVVDTHRGRRAVVRVLPGWPV
jgi:hypothetical protein